MSLSSYVKRQSRIRTRRGTLTSVVQEPLHIIVEEELAPPPLEEPKKSVKAKRRHGVSDLHIPRDSMLFAAAIATQSPEDGCWKLTLPDDTTLDFPRPPTAASSASGSESDSSSSCGDFSSPASVSSGLPTSPSPSPTFDAPPVSLVQCISIKPLTITKRSVSPVPPAPLPTEEEAPLPTEEDDLPTPPDHLPAQAEAECESEYEDDDDDDAFYAAHLRTFITLTPPLPPSFPVAPAQAPPQVQTETQTQGQVPALTITIPPQAHPHLEVERTPGSRGPRDSVVLPPSPTGVPINFSRPMSMSLSSSRRISASRRTSTSTPPARPPPSRPPPRTPIPCDVTASRYFSGEFAFAADYAAYAPLLLSPPLPSACASSAGLNPAEQYAPPCEPEEYTSSHPHPLLSPARPHLPARTRSASSTPPPPLSALFSPPPRAAQGVPADVCADDDAEWASDVYDDDAAYGDVPLSPLVVALPSPSSESASASGSESAPSTPASAVFDDRVHSTDALDELEYASGSEYGYGYGYNEGGDDAESDWEPSPSYGYTGWHTRPAPSSSTAFTPPQQQLKSRWSSSTLSSVRSAQAVHSPKLGGFAIARRYFPLSTSPKSSSKAKASASSTNASPTSGRKSLNLRLGGGKKITTADVLVVGRPPATPSLLGGVVDVFSAPSLSPSIKSRSTSKSKDKKPKSRLPPPMPIGATSSPIYPARVRRPDSAASSASWNYSPSVLNDSASECGSACSSESGGMRRKPIPVEMFLR